LRHRGVAPSVPADNASVAAADKAALYASVAASFAFLRENAA